MAIPIADLQKQIQTPNVEKGQALDLSGNIKQLGAIAQDTLQQMQSSTSVIGKFMIAEKKAEEEQKANDAFTDFAEKSMTALQGLQNTEAHMTGEYNKKTYTPTMEKLDIELISKINSIEDPVVREKLRQQANDFKLNQKMKASGYVFSQKKAAEKTSSDKFIATKEQTFLNDVTYDSERNLTVLERDLREIKYKNQSTAISVDGIIDNRYVELKTQESADKMVENAVAKMEELADSKDFFGGYAEVKKFLEKSKKYLSPEKFEELASDIDKKELEVEILRNTDKFVKNGEIDRALVYEHGKNLSYYEKEQMIRRIQKELKENAGNLSKEDAQDVKEMEIAQAGQARNKLYKTGLKPADFYDFLAKEEKLSPEEKAEIIARDFKNVKPIEVIKAYSYIQSEMEKPVTLKSGKTVYIRSNEAERVSEALARFFDFYANTYGEESDELTDPEGFFQNIFGKNLTIGEVGVDRIIRAARVVDKDGNVSYVQSRNALASGVSYFRHLEKFSIDDTQLVEDSKYKADDSFQMKTHFSLAEGLADGNLKIKDKTIADQSFAESYDETLSTKIDKNSTADDFFGPEAVSYSEADNMPLGLMLTSVSGPYTPPWQQVNLANKIRQKRFEEKKAYIKKQEAARLKYKKQLEEEAKKLHEESKKKKEKKNVNP